MTSNLLHAIHNIIQHEHFELRTLYKGRNRTNSMGEALESYIKDAFANTLDEENVLARMQAYNLLFSWLGGTNNPPDLMMRGGDAVEVKKIQKANNPISLNSSYPKADLRTDSPMLTEDCKKCERWTRKDLIYAVGHVSDTRLHSLWLVYGHIYAAKPETYQRIKKTISAGIDAIPDVELSDTKELGRINRVDALGIASLRIRGMWQILNPRKVFDYLHQPTNHRFELVAIIPTDKYLSFPEHSRHLLEKIDRNTFKIDDVQVQNPNNLSDLIDCKLIRFYSNK